MSQCPMLTSGHFRIYSITPMPCCLSMSWVVCNRVTGPWPMSSQESAPTLRIRPRRSAILTGFVIFTHGGAIICLLLSLPFWMGALAAIGIVYSLVYSLNRHVLMTVDDAITELTWESNGEWLVVMRNGTRLSAQLLQSAYLHARLVILNFALNGRNRSVILLPDTLDPDTFRRLRVRLQLHHIKATG